MARGSAQPVLVTGFFDVLLAGHVRDLRCVRERAPAAALFVALLPPQDPVLSPRARAEMVAALEMVDYVVSSEDGRIESLVDAFPAGSIVHLEPDHERRMRELIDHVHGRQSR